MLWKLTYEIYKIYFIIFKYYRLWKFFKEIELLIWSLFCWRCIKEPSWLIVVVSAVLGHISTKQFGPPEGINFVCDEHWIFIAPIDIQFESFAAISRVKRIKNEWAIWSIRWWMCVISLSPDHPLIASAPDLIISRKKLLNSSAQLEASASQCNRYFICIRTWLIHLGFQERWNIWSFLIRNFVLEHIVVLTDCHYEWSESRSWHLSSKAN